MEKITTMENVKITAWEFLIKLSFTRLPINVMKINSMNIGIKIASYDEAKDYIEYMGYIDYANEHDGFAIQDADTIRIFYSDKLCYHERTIVIAHELAHYVLGHTSSNDILGKSQNEKQENEQEEEANAFVYPFLSPSPVLLEADIRTPRDISRVTGLSEKMANIAALDVVKEETAVHTPIERQLIQQFNSFIKCTKHGDTPPEIHYKQPELQPAEPIEIIEPPKIIERERPIIYNMTSSQTEKPKKSQTLIATFAICITCIIISAFYFLQPAVATMPNTIADSPTVVAPEQNTPATDSQSVQPQQSVPATTEPVQPQQSVPATTESVQPQQSVPAIVQPKSADTNTNGTTVAEKTVYILTHGEVYNTNDNCQYIKNKTNVNSLTESEAKKMGLSWCKICKGNTP